MDGAQQNDDRTARIEMLIRTLDAHPGDSVTAAARELVALVLDLHGSAWLRLLELIEALPHGDDVRAAMLDDVEIAAMLLLHGLHPNDSIAIDGELPAVATVPLSSITVRATGQRIAGAHA